MGSPSDVIAPGINTKLQSRSFRYGARARGAPRPGISLFPRYKCEVSERSESERSAE